ncbi:aconitase X [Mesorhizobium helmanticense]|uniref:Aconitase subunit 1 n=1 Tax=Mesorhizobium helmanticense TaxID=1776423 RepID=A0A2T4IQF0_9HYPH|nr:aconitase X [Mesorhizobium helmanticense]PTE07859.1 aconitase subunit 1 [Mesorhizobium helmanticense]
MMLELSADDQSMLQGEHGPAAAAAMKILVAFSNAVGAPKLLDISGAHIDGCLYHGKAGLDFVERLVEGNGRVLVPTTLNVGSFDLIHPGMVKMPAAQEAPARRLMKAHLELGCQATFTCAPYQTRFRPGFGEQIAWGESNAIVFANSVIGARTNRYGDFIDLCCAMTGRAPSWGLHLSENRRGQILFELTGAFEPSDALFVGVGLIIGRASGDRIPVISGLPQPRDEDQLKALGAAAATTGAVALFHAVSITPEANTIDEAFHGMAPDETIRITRADIDHALAKLSSVPDGAPLAAVSLGTPHFSHEEWMRLLPLLRELAPSRGIPIYVNTGRATLTRLQDEGALAGMEAFGLIPVADTCTYVTAIIERLDGVVMTNSGKWAHYAPGNIGVSVAFADIRDCIRSAAVGHVLRSVS